MGHLGFSSSRVDPDVWMRLSKRSTGEEYYEYVLLYVDDVLVISERAEQVLRQELGQHFVLCEESIGKPSNYLGGYSWKHLWPSLCLGQSFCLLHSDEGSTQLFLCIETIRERGRRS